MHLGQASAGTEDDQMSIWPSG